MEATKKNISGLTGRLLPQVFGLPGLAALTPVALIVAHFFGGAASDQSETVYELSLIHI